MKREREREGWSTVLSTSQWVKGQGVPIGAGDLVSISRSNISRDLCGYAILRTYILSHAHLAWNSALVMAAKIYSNILYQTASTKIDVGGLNDYKNESILISS